MIPLLPTRPTLHEALPYFHPFGVTRAHNALEGFHGSSPDLAPDGLKVLFLGCSDLRGPLAAASRPVHQNLEVHINNKSLPSIARSALILKVISSQTFDPEDETDMDYIWDLWYNTTWPESTLKRFMEDVKSLMDGPLPDNIIFPRSQEEEDFKNIWASWLTMIKTMSVESVLNDRSDVLVKCWTRQVRIVIGNPLLEELSLSESAIKATQLFEHDIRCDLWADGATDSSMPLARKICEEINQYFVTGNCSAGPVETKTLAVNPTLLQPSSGKWLINYSVCPFAGYFPLPRKELKAKPDGTALSYCRNELKKLLIAFRKRMDEVKFFFRPCDAMALCYEESLEEFDVIDTSDLSDHVGLVNLLNAATRKLRSDQSVLFTESSLWPKMACNLCHYVQKALYCPLSLIPTIYGLRLVDDVELGLGTVRSVQRMYGSSTRLRWSEVLPFGGVTLDPTDPLTTAFDQLRMACFAGDGKSSSCTPLTFRYVMSDFFRRAGVTETNCLWKKSFPPESIPPVHRMSFGTLQALMERRPVWRVRISVPFDPTEHSFIMNADRELIPVLRLVLTPNSLCSAANSSGTDGDELNHFIDNFGLKLESSCEEGTVNEVDVTFLLEDRSLLDTHSGIVVNLLNKSPVFHIGKLSDRRPQVDLFAQSNPWTEPSGTPNGTKPRTKPSRKTKKLFIESFEEVVGFYKIVFHALTKRPQHPLQLQGSPDRDMRQWPCESAHRITIECEGFDPVVITFPHPVEVKPANVSYPIAECEKTKEHDIEVIFRKAPKDIWPGDVLQDRFRWDAEELQPLTKSEYSMHFHLMAQFHPESSFKRSIKDTPALGNIREKLLMMFHKVRKEGVQHFRAELKGGSDWVTNLQWLIRVHPPVRMSPQGVPILLLSAMDFRLMLKLKDLKRLDGKNCGDTLSRNMCDESTVKSAPIWLHSDEEVRLFRYILRLNSTRMRPAAWHSENLKKEEAETPWLATFLQPLYLDCGLGLEGIIRMMTIKDLSELGGRVCAHCRIGEEDMLKRCGRCKAVSYCSPECQRADWKNHKPSCSKPKKKD